MPLLAITVTRGGRVLDIFDKIIMENEVGRRSNMQEVFEAGNYPLRIRLSHLPEDVIKEIEGILFTTERPVQERFFKGRGVDFRKTTSSCGRRKSSFAAAMACRNASTRRRKRAFPASMPPAMSRPCRNSTSAGRLFSGKWPPKPCGLYCFPA